METYLYKHFYAILVMMRKVDQKVFICVFTQSFISQE